MEGETCTIAENCSVSENCLLVYRVYYFADILSTAMKFIVFSS